MSNSRTIRPNGALIRLLRNLRGWSREAMVEASQLVMEGITKTESERSPLSRRVRMRIDKDRSAGIGLTTLVRVENESTPVFWSTLWIIAQTLEVSVESLVASDQPASSIAPGNGDYGEMGQQDNGSHYPDGYGHGPRMERELELVAKNSDDPDRLD